MLWTSLTDPTPSVPLDGIREHWRAASEKDVPALLAEVAGWQERLWKLGKIGSYMGGDTRQAANDPAGVNTQPLEVSLKPGVGQSEVLIHLTSKMITGSGEGGKVIWKQPRMEGAKKAALLLRDYASFGPAYEVDYPSIFANSGKYLAAVAEMAADSKLAAEDVAKKRGLDVELMKRWVATLAVEPRDPQAGADQEAWGPAEVLKPLEEQAAPKDKTPAIKGWHRKGTDLPVVMSNASDKTENIPGRMGAHKVCVHPMPSEFVAVAWKSPVSGKVRIEGKIAHVHAACGNGVEWWVEHRRGDQAARLAGSVIELGHESPVAPQVIDVNKGDSLVVVVDARNGNHICDLTEVNFTVSEEEKGGRSWDLAGDVADNILEGNPHGDKSGGEGRVEFSGGAFKELEIERGWGGNRGQLGAGSMARGGEGGDGRREVRHEVQTLLSGTARQTKRALTERCTTASFRPRASC